MLPLKKVMIGGILLNTSVKLSYTIMTTKIVSESAKPSVSFGSREIIPLSLDVRVLLHQTHGVGVQELCPSFEKKGCSVRCPSFLGFIYVFDVHSFFTIAYDKVRRFLSLCLMGFRLNISQVLELCCEPESEAGLVPSLCLKSCCTSQD